MSLVTLLALGCGSSASGGAETSGDQSAVTAGAETNEVEQDAPSSAACGIEGVWEGSTGVEVTEGQDSPRGQIQLALATYLHRIAVFRGTDDALCADYDARLGASIGPKQGHATDEGAMAFQLITPPGELGGRVASVAPNPRVSMEEAAAMPGPTCERQAIPEAEAWQPPCTTCSSSNHMIDPTSMRCSFDAASCGELRCGFLDPAGQVRHVVMTRVPDAVATRQDPSAHDSRPFPNR